MKTIARWLVSLFAMAIPVRALAQLSPPGMGEAESASWLALGARQQLDEQGRFSWLSYVGMGRSSGADDAHPLVQSPAILVVNNELYDQFRDNFFYSFALSFRRQQEHDDTMLETTLARELRMYARFAHVARLRRIKLTSALRPELRTFTFSDENEQNEQLALRVRAKEQLAWSVDSASVHRVIASAEALAATGKTGASWHAFGYQETRLCLYYSLTPPRAAVTFDVGYMNDLLRSAHGPEQVHYLAVDLVWNNPFG